MVLACGARAGMGRLAARLRAGAELLAASGPVTGRSRATTESSTGTTGGTGAAAADIISSMAAICAAISALAIGLAAVRAAALVRRFFLGGIFDEDGEAHALCVRNRPGLRLGGGRWAAVCVGRGSGWRVVDGGVS